MMNFFLLLSKQGKVRLSKWYFTQAQKDRQRIIRDVCQAVLPRQQELCNFVEIHEHKVVYRRYASLYFIAGVDKGDNELIVLEQIQHFVEMLDQYFGSVSELDLIFGFHKAYYLLDEVFIGGNLQETSKDVIMRSVKAQDQIVEEARQGKKDVKDAKAVKEVKAGAAQG